MNINIVFPGILVTMTEFTMTHNSFKSLPQSLGKLVNLKKLVLRSNKIIELFTDIKYLTQLRYIHTYIEYTSYFK